GQVLERDLVLGGLDRLAVDLVDHAQREVALAVLGPADAAGQVVAGAQVEAADLRGRDEGVVRAGQVAGLGRAQEAEAVGRDLEHAVGGDAFRGTGQDLQQREDHVLLARAGDGLGDAELIGDVEQLLRRHPLQVAQRVLRETFGDDRHRPIRLLVVVVVARQAVVTVAVAVAVAAVAEAVAAAAVAVAALALLRLAVVLLAAARLPVVALAAVAASSGGFGRGRRGRRLRGRLRF